jgi:hypothetical protein
VPAQFARQLQAGAAQVPLPEWFLERIVYPATDHSPNWERPQQEAADLDAFVQAP